MSIADELRAEGATKMKEKYKQAEDQRKLAEEAHPKQAEDQRKLAEAQLKLAEAQLKLAEEVHLKQVEGTALKLFGKGQDLETIAECTDLPFHHLQMLLPS